MSRFRYSIMAVQDNGQEITLLETNDRDLAIKGFELHGMVIPEHNRLGLARIVRLEMHEDVVLDKTLFMNLPEMGKREI